MDNLFAEQILEPINMYKNRFKNTFAENASAYLADILKKANIDEAANAKLVGEIDDLNNKIANVNSDVNLWKTFLKILNFCLILEAIIIVVNMFCGRYRYLLIYLPVVILIVFGIALVSSEIDDFKGQISNLENQVKNKIKEAFEMMWPLNRQFQWGTLNDLVMKTLPSVKIDPFFNRERLRQLWSEYGFENFGDDCSVCCCQSGTYNGNPWLMADVMNQEWTTVTYYGSKVIKYTKFESYTDSDGKIRHRWVTKTQTLTASYDAPAPKYYHNKYLIYGHDAAPNLTFCRTPSNVAGDEGKVKDAINSIEKLSQDLSKNFTVTSNREFDASFYAIDRSNEQQFRFLYGALAQQQTYDLLKDKEVGYGDDFAFEKINKLNVLSSDHMNKTNFSGDPKQFWFYDLEKAKAFFKTQSIEYFRSFYFSFAPLLCVQHYQSPAPSKVFSSDEPCEKNASNFEYEALANYMGQKMFAHDNAATTSIIKVGIESEGKNEATIVVTAYSFKTESHTKMISKFGDDWCFHDVPVEYLEYIPIVKSTRIRVINPDAADSFKFDEIKKTKGWTDLLSSVNGDESTLVYFRGLAAFKIKPQR